MNTGNDSNKIEVDVTKCRTLPQNSYYSHCLQNEPLCKHAVPFSFGSFCCHPNHSDFFNPGKETEDGDNS